MRAVSKLFCLILAVIFLVSCSTAYKAQPLPFRTPEAYPNAAEVAGTMVGAQAFSDKDEAQRAFGFDIRGAGMLPVQVVFDNRGAHPIRINPAQTFLEDDQGNLWPILSSDLAYERATKYAQTKQIVKEGAYHGVLGAAAGALIGAAVGVVTGDSIGTALTSGAALGGAAGATLGGAKGYGSGEARQAIISDLREKSLQNVPILPGSLAHGFLFFPGEATSATRLRLHLLEGDTGIPHVILMNF